MINKLKELFEDTEIKELAKHIQTKDPEKFIAIMKRMIFDNDFTSTHFKMLDKTLPTIDKYEYISIYNKLVKYGSEESSTGEIDEYKEYEFVENLKTLERKIYGFDFSDVEQERFMSEEDIINENINIYNSMYDENLSNLEEYQKELVIDLIYAYQTNLDSTCLFNVLELILSDDKYVKYVPYDHLKRLGVELLYPDSIFPEENQDILKVKYFFNAILVPYLTYNKKEHEGKDKYADSLSKAHIEDLDKQKEKYIIVSKKIFC